MKNTFKLIGIIVLAAVITFAMAACNNSANGGGSTTPGGGTLTIGATFNLSGEAATYEDPDDAAAKAAANFGYLGFYDEDTETYLIKPLSDYLTGTPKVEITDGKLTVTLGEPKPASMRLLIEEEMPGITVTPNNVKYFMLKEFYTEDGYHGLYLDGGEYVLGALVYVEEDVKINGTESNEDGQTIIWPNLSLKRGWNFLIMVGDKATETETITYSASRTYPAGLEWVVF